MGDVGRELRELGWKLATHLLTICMFGRAHTVTLVVN